MRSSRGRRSYLAGLTRSPVHTSELTSKQEQARIAAPTLWGNFGLIRTTPGISMAPYYSRKRPPACAGGLCCELQSVVELTSFPGLGRAPEPQVLASPG